MKCEHEHDDGAYVLGALSPAERAAYEQHLATCSFCREAVADIAVLPGLLGRLDPADFARLLDPDQAPKARDRMPELVTAAQATRRRERQRSRTRLVGAVLAVACLALLIGVGLLFGADRGTSPATASAGVTVAMSPVGEAVPVSARINVAGAAGGTRIDLVCSYERTSAGLKPYTVRLLAYGPDEQTEQLGSWVAAPGKEFKMTGVTHFASGALSRVELVRQDGRALLAYDVP